MRKRIWIIVMGILLIFSAFIVINGTYSNKIETPVQVIKSFYNYLDKGNSSKIQNYLLEKKNSSFKNLENLESTKIININEDLTSNIKDGYLQGHKDTTIDPNNIKVFRVEYSVKYKDDTKEPLKNGNHEVHYILIRKSIDSPWLIADWGF